MFFNYYFWDLTHAADAISMLTIVFLFVCLRLVSVILNSCLSCEAFSGYLNQLRILCLQQKNSIYLFHPFSSRALKNEKNRFSTHFIREGNQHLNNMCMMMVCK